jgi:hypothetical protein
VNKGSSIFTEGTESEKQTTIIRTTEVCEVRKGSPIAMVNMRRMLQGKVTVLSWDKSFFFLSFRA